jgi:hypothetical protein
MECRKADSTPVEMLATCGGAGERFHARTWRPDNTERRRWQIAPLAPQCWPPRDRADVRITVASRQSRRGQGRWPRGNLANRRADGGRTSRRLRAAPRVNKGSTTHVIRACPPFSHAGWRSARSLVFRIHRLLPPANSTKPEYVLPPAKLQALLADAAGSANNHDFVATTQAKDCGPRCDHPPHLGIISTI